MSNTDTFVGSAIVVRKYKSIEHGDVVCKLERFV